MTNYTGGSTRSGQGNPKIQSFLEALRNSQAKTFENGRLDGRPNPFAEFQQKKEAEKRRAEQFFQARQQEWNKVFSAKEKQKEQRIEEIREQLIKYSEENKKLKTNIVKVLNAPVAEAGEYHLSFFEHIKNVIHLATLQAQEANHWLELFRSRSRKQGVYWGMAKKSGTNYTQANERAIATSVG